MIFKHIAAVWNGKQERLAKIKRRVPADDQPEIAGASESKRKYQCDTDNAQCADRRLALIHQVDAAEAQRENPGGWPESDAVGQGKLQIAPECELFKQAYQHEKKRP